MTKHRQGGKFAKSHTSIIEAALPVIDKAKALPEVTKISPGVIKTGLGPTPRHRISFASIIGGLSVKVRGSTSLQEFFVYTSKPGRTQNQLTRFFNDS